MAKPATRFLIVEDHPFQREFLKQSLLQLGAETVHTAGNGVEAMRVLRDSDPPIDIVISDLMMPEVDGIELIPLLRQFPGISLILASTAASSLNAAVEIAKGYGVHLLGFIDKPITPEKLAPLIGLNESQRASDHPG